MKVMVKTMNLDELRRNGLLLMMMGENYSLTVQIIGFVLCAVIGYLLGSLNFSLIISKKKYGDDVRNHGSGNAGMTNMLRTFGKKAALFTFIGDGAKAALAVLIGTLLNGGVGASIAGLFCIIGHVYPCFFGFKGGKGVVTTAIMILLLDPLVFLILFVIFVIIVGFTKYMSLGSIMSVLLYPLILYNFKGSRPDFSVVVAVIIALFVVYLHRSNIKRLLEGKENKLNLSFTKKGKKTDGKKTDKKGGDTPAEPDTKSDDKKTEDK